MTERERELEALLQECADHLAGALGAADRPNSDSGELYQRIRAALQKHAA